MLLNKTYLTFDVNFRVHFRTDKAGLSQSYYKVV